jgi:hypothetical protein
MPDALMEILDQNALDKDGTLPMRIYGSAGLIPRRDGVGHQVVRLLNGAWPWGKNRRLARDLEWINPEIRKQVHALFTNLLRGLVGQWIDSGNKEGIDSPHRRDTYKVPPGYTKPLRDVIYAWHERHSPMTSVSPEGWYSMAFPQPEGGPTEKDAEEAAIYWLIELLNSPDSYRVARCANPECRSYYLRKRLRKAEIKCVFR